MKSASMVQLLKVVYLLFRKQKRFEKLFDSDYDFLNEEIKLLLHVILIHMGIVQGKDKSIFVVNTDHYEYVTKMYWAYCKGQVSEEDMMDIIHALKVEEVRYLANGEPLQQINPTGLVNVLFKVKHSIQTKRNKLGSLFGGDYDFLRMEEVILHIALELLGKKRYFNVVDLDLMPNH